MRPVNHSRFETRLGQQSNCYTMAVSRCANRFSLLVILSLVICGCQGTGPAKYDNPVVGPPPPRLPPDQIQRKKLAAAEMRRNRETQLAQNSDSDSSDEIGRPIRQAAARRSIDSSTVNLDDEGVEETGIQQVSLSNDLDGPVPKFEDGTIVATVNGQPIFAGEVLAPAVGAIANKEDELKKAMGAKFKPEMMDRVRAMIIAQALPRTVERKMLVHAAKTSFKKPQLEGMKKALEAQWEEHLQEMMTQNNVGSVSELEELFVKSKFNLEEHKAAFEDQKTAAMFVSSKVHSKFTPSRKEMIGYYQEHKEEFKSVGKVRWQQLVVSYEQHKSPGKARQHMDKVVQELLAGADFTATVKKYGDGPRVEKGGMWEWTERGALQSKEVEQEIFSLPVGDMSGVIETKNSLQIVQVLERTEDSYTPYEQLQEKIKEAMENAAYAEKANALLKEIRDAAIIETCFDDEMKRQKAAQNR